MVTFYRDPLTHPSTKLIQLIKAHFIAVRNAKGNDENRISHRGDKGPPASTSSLANWKIGATGIADTTSCTQSPAKEHTRIVIIHVWSPFYIIKITLLFCIWSHKCYSWKRRSFCVFLYYTRFWSVVRTRDAGAPEVERNPRYFFYCYYYKKITMNLCSD